MTKLPIEDISRMRADGLSYAKIAAALGASQNTIKSICQRNELGGRKALPETDITACQYCGKPITQRPGRRKRRFCSDACRLAWWKGHQERIRRKAVYKLTCANCGASFESYGNKTRKFCSHECYISHRFGKANADDA